MKSAEKMKADLKATGVRNEEILARSPAAGAADHQPGAGGV